MAAFTHAAEDSQAAYAGNPAAAAHPVPADGQVGGVHRGSIGVIYAVAAETRRAAAEEAGVDARISAFNVGETVLLPTLASPDGIAQARARLRQFEAMLAERNRIVEDALARSEWILAHAEFDYIDPFEVRRGLDRRRAAVETVYGELDRADRAAIAARDKVLDIAQANQGKITLQGGAVNFSTPDLKASYEALAERVANADRKAERARQKVIKLRQDGLRWTIETMKTLTR